MLKEKNNRGLSWGWLIFGFGCVNSDMISGYTTD